MSDAKPYTVAEWDAMGDEVGRDLDTERMTATVRALEAAEARLGSDGLCGHGASTCERCTDAWSRERRGLEKRVAALAHVAAEHGADLAAAVIEAAVLSERERCAALVEEWCHDNGAETHRDYQRSDDAHATCRKAAAAIRARVLGGGR